MKKEDEEEQNEEQNEDDINDLRTENELKKIKLSLEHGGDFSLPANADIPPEVESVWLDYMQQFEDEFSKNKKIQIYEFIGKPPYKKVEEIADNEIEAALDGIIEIMNKFNVVVDTICDVEERELYRFITEELFFHETNDIRIDGMKHYFIYEEFHPNHEYDIKNHCIDFIKSVFNKEKDWMPNFLGLANEIEASEGIIDDKKAIQKMEVFRDAFSEFDLKKFEILSLNISNEKAYVSFEIEYTAFIEGSNDSLDYVGNGNLLFKTENGFWNIYKINVPGLIV